MKHVKLVITGVLILLGILLITMGYGIFKINKEKNYFDGVYAGGMDLSGLTREEARESFDQYWNKLSQTEISVRVGEETETVKAEVLGLSYQNTDILEEAYEVGRNGGIFSRYNEVKKAEKHPVVIELDLTLDDTKAEKVIKKLTKKYEKPMKNASIRRKDGKFIIEKEESGLSIDYKASVQALKEKIRKEWDGKAPLSFEMISEVTEPEYKSDSMEKIKDKLGTYSTSYGTSSSGRKQNVAKGTEYINGTVLYPGEVLSVYEKTAPFTSERGFALAGAYENGKTVQSMGGGMCQVSTTLYNAVIRAELEVTERHPHSMTVSYVPRSADAAIAGTYKDLKFRNDQKTPIYIEGWADGSTISFTIWGEETRPANREIEIYSETLSSTPPKEKEVKDKELEEGKRETREYGHTGYQAKLWKIVKVDGKQTDKILLNTSSYASTTTVIAVGTKKKDKDKDKDKKDPLINGSEPDQNTTEEPDTTVSTGQSGHREQKNKQTETNR